tara:strand:- start:3485 stop:4411 length:927 start_codon:yes stop_codon:yes gene_type:complete
MKEVLVVYYSQTGQLFDILKSISATLQGEGVNLTFHEIIPKNAYNFPWDKEKFIDAFPESVLQIPTEINDPSPMVVDKKFDLVLLGIQVWYLSPSIPLNSFLKSEAAIKILKNTPVVTVIGARNMWFQAQEKVKKMLYGLQARLVGNIALVDRHLNHISVITIVYWLLHGKKDRMFGIFPRPGVSDADIVGAEKFGKPIREALLSGDFESLQQQLLGLDAVKIRPALISTEKRGTLIFSKWASLVQKKAKGGPKQRKKWLTFFKYYLLFAIWIISPIVFIVFLLTYIPLYGKIKRDTKYYSSVGLKDK